MYWSIESWGSDYPPVNADEIISAANAAIDRFAKSNPDYTEDELRDYSNYLWENFCIYGEINGVVAEYEE